MKFESIQSASNTLLKEVRRALSRGEPTESGALAAESPHLLEEAIRSGLPVETVICSASGRARVEAMAGLEEARMVETPDRVFASIASTESPQGVVFLTRCEPAPWERLFHFPALTVVLDGLQDPGNAGAIARAAEAFRATGIVFLKGSVSPYNAKTLRASAGSLFRVPFIEGVSPEELLAQARLHGAERWVTLPREGEPVATAALDEPCAMVIGNEGRGVSRQMAEGARALTIPTTGVESLNAAMAASIVLYEAFRQRMEG